MADARRIRNVAEHFAGRPFDHHHVRCAGYEHAPRGGFHGDVVSATVTLDVELLDLERLCAGHLWRRDVNHRKEKDRSQHMSHHGDLHESGDGLYNGQGTALGRAPSFIERQYYA